MRLAGLHALYWRHTTNADIDDDLCFDAATGPLLFDVVSCEGWRIKLKLCLGCRSESSTSKHHLLQPHALRKSWVWGGSGLDKAGQDHSGRISTLGQDQDGSRLQPDDLHSASLFRVSIVTNPPPPCWSNIESYLASGSNFTRFDHGHHGPRSYGPRQIWSALKCLVLLCDRMHLVVANAL